jgi:branched-chain amino acid transport system ATP-binding protein
MLTLNNVEVTYSNVILVLKGASMEVPNEAVISLLGANGAGKSTTLKAISGLLSTELGEVSDGSIIFDDVRIDHMQPEDIVRLGIVQIMEGRRVLQHLTTEENLMLGAQGNPHSYSLGQELDRIYDYFPRLRELRHNTSGFMSGGEQQMMVIGRGLMAHPKLMLLDEPSLGLAPLFVKEVFEIVQSINKREKMAILLVEQNARAALSIAEYGFIMENGRIVFDGPVDKLRENEDVKEFYLGLSEVGTKKSYREVKHYKRRKRWLG